MKVLCDSGLVNYRKEGKWMHYSISKYAGPLLQDVLEKYIKISIEK